MFHMSFQDWSMIDTWMCLKTEKTLKQHWNAVGRNWMDRTLFRVTVWDGRFVFGGIIRPQDATWGLNNSPGKDFFPWWDKHNRLFRLKRLLQVSWPLATCRLSYWCWALYMNLHQWLFRYKSYCWMQLTKHDFMKPACYTWVQCL